MDKYSVMLVDDEEDVIQVIIKKMDWEALGFSTPTYASNGLEALELAENMHPDVVMTDIKMPYIDGLELCRRLKEMYPDIRIIVFSGFNEFEYAKEAVHLDVQEYLLKPMDFNELTAIFERVKENLDKTRDEKNNLQRLQEYYMQSLPLLRENFYVSLIQGNIKEDEIDQYVTGYQIDLKGPCFCIAILHASPSHMPEGMDATLMALSVRRLAEETISKRWDCRYCTYLGNTVVIAQMKRKEDVIELTDELDMLCRLANDVSKIIVTAGIGPTVDGMMGLAESYKGARNAISYRALYGRVKAINITEIDPDTEGRLTQDAESELRPIFKMIKFDQGDVPLESLVDAFMAKNAVSFPSIQSYHLFVMNVFSELYRFAKNNELDTNAIFPDNEDVYVLAQQMGIDELSAWLKDVAERMRNMIQKKRNDTTRSFVEKARDYVKDHYDRQDLSVNVLCCHLGVSAAYFSTVFKRETGKTFVNYLTDYRMEKAVELLIERDEKTYVVAKKVGYADPNYFSYVFKKQFGMSPSRYKSKEAGK